MHYSMKLAYKISDKFYLYLIHFMGDKSVNKGDSWLTGIIREIVKQQQVIWGNATISYSSILLHGTVDLDIANVILYHLKLSFFEVPFEYLKLLHLPQPILGERENVGFKQRRIMFRRSRHTHLLIWEEEKCDKISFFNPNPAGKQKYIPKANFNRNRL